MYYLAITNYGTVVKQNLSRHWKVYKSNDNDWLLLQELELHASKVI